ncbi:DUF5123 domain-containing protein [Bacteroides clarus]|uniref:DUF5123 domain-containing protein n=1 Tax=Bacteroides clarus TaxID=626929 RepID=A0A412YGC7_9BACE|nr:DUF5123 domain-containing protein [Bacteroides clarus]RGV39793.1 DUF5123 domain-containing protein [Bacteroides clarus]RGV56465.1 DUF5123 domain-containing protein [Bacteroides clarus]
MRKSISSAVAGLMLLLGIAACSEDSKYNSSVVKDIQMYLDDEAYSLNTGSSNKPLFIYAADGSYVANYSTLYRFQLPDGTYRIVATTEADSLPHPGNLNDIVLNQDPKAEKVYALSAPVEYASPFDEPLEIRMYNRTGTLRLRATDRKADKRYSTIRAIVSTPISGYKISDATFVKSPIEVVRNTATSTGGVNYTDDLVLFETDTDNEAVTVRFEYLDANQQVIQTKEIEGTFPILPKNLTTVSFELNNADEPTIQDYTVTIAPEEWEEEDINPDAPIRVPEGYTYVSPGENINNVFNRLKNDETATDIKLFLKAGTTYQFVAKTLDDMPKGLSIMGQEPKEGENLAVLELKSSLSVSSTDDIEAFRFENLVIKVDAQDFFKFKNQEFHIGTISWKNCEINDLQRTMWYQGVDAAQKQTVNKIVIEDCRFFGLNSGESGLFGLASQDAPVHNFEFRNSTFHANDLNNALITRLGAMTGDLNVTIENCTFIAMKAGMTFFDLGAKSITNGSLTVRNNLFSGAVDSEKGTWFNIHEKITARIFENNYITNGFTLNNWGVGENEKPKQTALRMDELFRDVANRDFTITDKSSEIYTNNIGDPHWIK